MRVFGWLVLAGLLLAAPALAVAAGTLDVIAHRGGALLWPENTLYAFRQAAGAGAEYLEFDLQMTADNELLVTHDADINPSFCSTPDGSGMVPKPVRVLTLEQSRGFDCGTRSRAIYPDAEKRAAGMPSLEEVFEAFRDDANIRYFIETKVPKPGAPGEPIDTTLYAAKLDQLVRRYGLEDRVILQSFDWGTIRAMHELNPQVRTCPLGVPRKPRLCRHGPGTQCGVHRARRPGDHAGAGRGVPGERRAGVFGRDRQRGGMGAGP